MIRHIAVLGILASIAGCGSDRGSADRVIDVAQDDQKMNAAMEKARSTVGTFTTALASPKPGQRSFTVKVPFSDGKNTEHMWLSPVTFDGTKFHGTINNDAERVSHVKNGDHAEVEPSKISDWMFVDEGKLVGGYTLRVLRDSMSPAERAEFDKSVDFVVE
jgi:uncharacterized protein YegJ (DUF2314 family)